MSPVSSHDCAFSAYTPVASSKKYNLCCFFHIKCSLSLLFRSSAQTCQQHSTTKTAKKWRSIFFFAMSYDSHIRMPVKVACVHVQSVRDSGIQFALQNGSANTIGSVLEVDSNRIREFAFECAENPVCSVDTALVA